MIIDPGVEEQKNENLSSDDSNYHEQPLPKKFQTPSVFSNKIHPTSKPVFLNSPARSSTNSDPETVPILGKPLTIRRSNTLVDSFTLKLNLIRGLIIVSFELAFDYLSVISLILMTYYRLDYFPFDFKDACFGIEVVVLIYFTLELANFARHGKETGFTIGLCFKMCCNFLMIFQILWFFGHQPYLSHPVDITILINVIRSFRVYSVRKFFIQAKKVVSPCDNDINESLQMGYFILTHVIYLFTGLFMEATLFLAVDALDEFQGFTKSKYNDFEYIGALYFSIVCLTTIGYGDIYPISTASRMVLIVILLINLNSVSLFLSKLTDVIYLISPYIKRYTFKNHLIVVGQLPATFLRYFLQELQEYDKIQKKLLNQNSEQSKLEHVLIIDKNKPSVEVEMILEDTSFEFDIKYLMDNMLTKQWCELSNLKEAKRLFIFAIDHQENERMSVQNDLSTLAMAKRLEMEYTELNMTLVLSTDAFDSFKSFSFSRNVTVLSHQLLNNQIMANSLENQGFSTWLTHLMTLRMKVVPFNSEFEGKESNFFRLYEYSKCMTQEIYPISCKIRFFFILNIKIHRIPKSHLQSKVRRCCKKALFQRGELLKSGEN